MSDIAKKPLFLIYSAPHGNVEVEVTVRDETLWVTQKTMAAIFGVGVPAVNKHLVNIYEEGELDQEATISKMEIVQNEGTREVTRTVDIYSLDAIISVGYRVNSRRATQFRIWATTTLKEYVQKGFVMDDERLKQGKAFFGRDYFRELLERVRSIRASERRIWQQITDIFAECSTDYDKDSPTTQEFFATIQNYTILMDKGRITRAKADAKAGAEYDIFNRTQKIDSDFDRSLRRLADKMEGGEYEKI